MARSPEPYDNFKAWNEAMAQKYNPEDYHNRSPRIVRWIERRRIRLIREMLDPGPDLLVLEVGCGSGNVLEMIETGRIVGADLSRSLLGIAAGKKYRTWVFFVRAAAELLPFPDGAFHRVICSEVLEHVPDPGAVCEEISRLLARDGRFVVSVPNEGLINRVKRILKATGLLRLLNRSGAYQMSEDMTDMWHLHTFGFKKLRDLLEPRFEIREVSYAPFRLLPLRIVALCRKRP